MSRTLRILWGGIVCLVAAPGWACAGRAEPSSHALALGYFAQEIENATRFDGRRPGIRIDLVDLNGDGCPDAIVVFRSAFLGGARGCSSHILDMGLDPPKELGGALTCGLRSASSRTNGWLDLLGDSGGRWVLLEGRYQWVDR